MTAEELKFMIRKNIFGHLEDAQLEKIYADEFLWHIFSYKLVASLEGTVQTQRLTL